MSSAPKGKRITFYLFYFMIFPLGAELVKNMEVTDQRKPLITSLHSSMVCLVSPALKMTRTSFVENLALIKI